MLKYIIRTLKMTRDVIYIPFPKELYDDIIRFSDGTQDPASIAEWRVRGWVENLDNASEDWGDRAMEVAEKYNPETYERWLQQESEQMEAYAEKYKPLIWKEITVRSHSGVRMSYAGTVHFAEVRNGKIVDRDGQYSPSAWASKIAGGTARNAWRDIWFKDLTSPVWVPAQMMRAQAKDDLTAKLNPLNMFDIDD
jgi:hypothetical protein